jgi:hypothetical protein
MIDGEESFLKVAEFIASRLQNRRNLIECIAKLVFAQPIPSFLHYYFLFN